ncbi:hypothetical protein BpHYR1_027991 [Brachionus plicatilis]|uniref:Uncharacterized protein n=1 Tax=Brachionus plicatilis TaxID=10195 RepID=A0A3M7SA21_BRAPC|nr:hypothetical protein BpHYR1_027991 [Brachionus plicatilis]
MLLKINSIFGHLCLLLVNEVLELSPIFGHLTMLLIYEMLELSPIFSHLTMLLINEMLELSPIFSHQTIFALAEPDLQSSDLFGYLFGTEVEPVLHSLLNKPAFLKEMFNVCFVQNQNYTAKVLYFLNFLLSFYVVCLYSQHMKMLAQLDLMKLELINILKPKYINR